MTSAHLRILETTDLHMHLLGYDYVSGTDTHSFGLSHVAPMIAKARAEAAHTLLFDNGDFLQGTPLAEHLVKYGKSDTHHPMIKAMNALAFDAITLGNHEFDYGLDYLLRTLATAEMPVVCANLRNAPQKTLLPPWTMLTRSLLCDDGEHRDIKIGVIGFVTPQIVDWDAHLLAGELMTDDIVFAARSYLPQLERAGADLVIALCHSGISAGPHHERMENAALALATLPGIDVILSGHTHDLFPDPKFADIDGVDVARATLHGKPTVMAGANGATLGIMDLTLAWDPDGWQIDDHTVTLAHTGAQDPTPDDPVARSIADSIAVPHQATMIRMRSPVATTSRRLTSFGAAIGVDDVGNILAQAQMSSVRAALAGTEYADLPLLASTTSFRAGGHGGPDNFVDIAPGPVLLGEVAAMAPFDNPVCAVLLRGWQVRQWLEETSRYFQVADTNTTPQPLINPQVPPYHFDTLHGLRYRIELRVPPRPSAPSDGAQYRVRDVTYQGHRLEDDQFFIVATSSYRAYGGGSQLAANSADVIFTSRRGLMTLTADDLKQHGIPDGPAARVWDFVPASGIALQFAGAPALASLLNQPTWPDITPGPHRKDGFQDFILHL